MKKTLFIGVLFMLSLIGCTNEESTRELLGKEGYENIEITGYRFFECSKDDWYHTGFTAIKNGNVITGTVCEGMLFKGKTIRYD